MTKGEIAQNCGLIKSETERKKKKIHLWSGEISFLRYFPLVKLSKSKISALEIFLRYFPLQNLFKLIISAFFRIVKKLNLNSPQTFHIDVEIFPITDVEEILHILNSLQSSALQCRIPHRIRIYSVCSCRVPHIYCGVPHMRCRYFRYGMVLFRISWKFDSFKNSGCHGNKS